MRVVVLISQVSQDTIICSSSVFEHAEHDVDISSAVNSIPSMFSGDYWVLENARQIDTIQLRGIVW